MIQSKHFNLDDEFLPLKYLTDNTITYQEFKTEEIKIIADKLEEFKIFCKNKYKLKYLGYDLYSQDFTITFQKYNHLRKTEKVAFINYNIHTINYNEFYKSIEEFVPENFIPNGECPKIHFITNRNNMPMLVESDLPSKVTLDLQNSYNTSYDINKILSDIKSTKSGLMLFTGLPGTGKTTLIKYLAQTNRDLKFCFITNNNIGMLSDPNFLDFCIEELSDSVIILEDCENSLLSREASKSYDISTILNLTDGIIGDLLNIKIIATLNTTDKIDSALLRKGRLICKAEFDKLTVEQGKNLAKSLDKDIEVTEEMCLTDIYNIEDNGYTTKKQTKLGF